MPFMGYVACNICNDNKFLIHEYVDFNPWPFIVTHVELSTTLIPMLEFEYGWLGVWSRSHVDT